MKRYLAFTALLACLIVLSNCGSTKKAVNTTPVAKLTYESTMMTLVVDNCSPCHIPSKGGNKKAYDNFANLSADIDEIIRRIEMEPATRGFMPFKRAKLSDSTIAVFKQWKADGLLEK